MYKIKTNKARCKLCDTVVVSINRHHFTTCKCGEISVDGGTDYLKRSAKDLNNIEELSEYTEEDNTAE